MEIEEDSLLLGTVERIEGTTVFVKLENGQRGTITTSEIAAGRIKNMREYVAPNKIIVCKVLRILKDHIDLSLRRVSAKEKKEFLEKHRKEKDIEIALKSLLKENFSKTIEKIKKDFDSLNDFIEKLRGEEKLIKKYFSKELEEQIKKLIEKRKKEVEVRKIIKLKCFEYDGIKRIKEIFRFKEEKLTITYISAGAYLLRIKAEDYKIANHKMQEITEEIEKRVKTCSCELSIEEKK
jgi:translation initiation factor 2 alpha subunit (eIF-2alpha)